MLSIRENVESFYFTSPPGEDEEMSIAMQKVGEMQEGIQSCLQEATTKKILFPPLLLYLFPRRACWRCCRALRSPIEAAHDAELRLGGCSLRSPDIFSGHPQETSVHLLGWGLTWGWFSVSLLTLRKINPTFVSAAG